jgi:hypothetical protein
LSSLIKRARREASPPFGPRCYQAQARELLAEHRQHWRGRSHWVVIEATKPRGTAVAWADDPLTAQRVASELAHVAPRSRFVVEQRRARPVLTSAGVSAGRSDR